MQKNIYHLLFFLLLSSLFSFSHLLESSEKTLNLKDQIQKAQSGDYLVSYQNKMYTLLHIHSIFDGNLVIEEINISQPTFTSLKMNWKQWVKNGAPHHTSWVMYEMKKTTGKITKLYSFSESAWLKSDASSPFLETLLNLKLKKIPNIDRKKIGPAPFNGEIDRRKLWQPKMVVEGKKIKGVSFDAWRTSWPKDGSELAGKALVIYLPKLQDARFIHYFPYWLQISGLVGKAQIRIVDTGKHLFSPKLALPYYPYNDLK